MISLLAVLALLTSSARAEDLAPVESPLVGMPIGGVNFVLGNDCSIKVVGHVPAAKTSTVLEAGSRVAGRCFAEKAALASQVRKDKQAEERSASEDKMIAKLDQENGGFQYVSDHNADGSDHTEILGGPTAIAHQFVDTLNGFDPSMSGLNSKDPSMVLANVITTNGASRGGGTVYLYPTATATPLTAAAPATAAVAAPPVNNGSAALSACQAGLKTATGLLAECRSGK